MSKQEIKIYTDGAARGNPGPGGYGVVMLFGSLRKEISKGYSKTTNNRMELLAVIVGLEAVKRKELKIKVYSDSRYVVDAVNKGWLWDWEKKRFRKKKNPDLWIRFITIYKQLIVELIWVKGHASIPENERCDELAVEASKGKKLEEDEGYLEQADPDFFT